MLLTLLALGVDLIVIVAFVGFVLSRKRWVKRQPGAAQGAQAARRIVVRVRAGAGTVEVAAPER